LVAALTACSALIGTRDLELTTDDDAGTSPANDGGAGVDSGDHVDGAPGKDGAIDVSADAPNDAPPVTCQADLQADPAHCGRCGHGCLGGACKAGVCQPVVLAQGQNEPAGIAVDATRVYWSNYGGWTIMAANKDGTSAVVLAHDAEGNVASPWEVAVDNGVVYWANHMLNKKFGDPLNPGRIAKCAATGCNQIGTVVATDLHYPDTVAVDDARVFWTEAYGHVVGRANKADGTQAGSLVALPDQGNSVNLDATHVYFTTSGLVGRIAKDAPFVDGGAPYQTIYADSSLTAYGVIADAVNVYWAVDANPGLIQFAPKTGLTGGATPSVLAGSQLQPYDIALDDANVYWTSFGVNSDTNGDFDFLDSTISMCPKAGCPASGPIVLATKQHHAHHIAVDKDAVYWTNKGQYNNATAGSVMKVAKP
jgi:hypothetical protein